MGHIREERLVRLLENALLEYLKDGTIPTTGELETSYNEKQAEHGDLVRSAVRRAETPSLYGKSSAAEINTFIDGLAEDMDVLFKALTKVSSAGILSLTEWSARANSLQVRLDKLVSRTESLLLTQSDTAGYVAFVEDGFTSGENISNDTTALIDTDNGEVIVTVNSSSGVGADNSNAINLEKAKLSFGIIQQTGSTDIRTRKRVSLQNLVTTTARNWATEIITDSSGQPLAAEIIVELPEKKEITQITLQSDDPVSSKPLTVALQYSLDGYTWEDTGAESSIQSGRGNFVFRFEKLKMGYFKFVLQKSSHDAFNSLGKPFYSFALNSIKAYSQVFDTGTGKDLYTELRTPQLAENNISFAQATLEVCDETPDDTTIDYYLRAYDGSSYTNWIKTVPVNRRTKPTNLTTFDRSLGYPVVDFATPQKDNSDELTTTFDTTLDTEAINLLRNYGSTGLSYRFKSANDSFCNFYVPTSLDLISDITMMRNYGYTAAKFPTVTTDLTVRDVECGWGLLGEGAYYCSFYIEDANGKTIDFGLSTAEIDGQAVSGPKEIPFGWHVFKTNRANWIALSGSNPTNEAELKAIDPLYPYNHKYLIEGFEYAATYKGEKVYEGVDRYCQYCSKVQATSPQEVGTATRVGPFQLFNSSLNTGIFALDEIGTNKTILLLKVNSGKADQVNERVRLYYTRRYESFTGIQLKANLSTKNATKTPVLSYYRIRVK